MGFNAAPGAPCAARWSISPWQQGQTRATSSRPRTVPTKRSILPATLGSTAAATAAVLAAVEGRPYGARQRSSSGFAHLAWYTPDHDEVTFRPGLPIPQPLRYATRDWLRNLITWPGSPLLRRISAPVFSFTGWAVLVTALSTWVKFPPFTLSMHALVGTALGLLLVFRTNTANDRYWEGRKMWETVVSCARDIAMLSCAFIDHLGTDRVRHICYLLSAFPICLARHVCSGPSSGKSPQPRHTLPLKRLLTQEERSAVASSSSPPSRIVQLLLAETTQVVDCETCLFTNRERSTLSSWASKLLGTVAIAERLVQTPIPQSYVRHTSRFLSLWLLTLPLGLCPAVGWWTPLIVWMASWSLCGIQELGQVIEHPFDGPQSLRLAVMSNTVHASVTDALMTVAAMRGSGLLKQILYRQLPEGATDSLNATELHVVDDVLGRTALHHAAYVGDKAMVQILLDAGADIDAVDTWDGSTPLDVARARNHIEVAKLLLERGAQGSVFSKSKDPVPWKVLDR